MATDNIELITIKLNTLKLPANVQADPNLLAKAFFIVGPYSTGFDKAVNAYNAGYYKKHNQQILDRHHVLCSSAPVWANVNDGMWLTYDELTLFLSHGEAYTAIINEVRNGTITVKNENTGTVYTAIDLQNLI